MSGDGTRLNPYKIPQSEKSSTLYVGGLKILGGRLSDGEAAATAGRPLFSLYERLGR
jgi:hypothetical protein